MVIAIDLTALSYHMTGIERYAMCITEEMLKIDKENRYILIFRDKIYPTFIQYIDGEQVKTKIIHGNNKLLFYQLVLPKALYTIKADQYLFFAFTSPILFSKKGIINTIHDMGPWDSGDSLKLLQKIYLKTTCYFSAKNSEKIITVSRFSRRRIAEILGFPKNRIRVIPSAVYERVIDLSQEDDTVVKRKYKLPDKYIMSLSTLEPRKNLNILLEAYVSIMDKIDYDLVLVGRKGWKMDEILKKYDAQERIHITGFVEDKDVAHIYKNALCFVFPSKYEGFGLPPVEALALGTPVIASNAASIPEVLMDRATYFDYENVMELQELLKNLNSNIKKMSCHLNEYQKKNYRFDTSAKKVLEFIRDESINSK